jgi:flavin reductase (DIM6/NTAB) family NADH-FMN oxidoreductase RutF
MPAFGDRMYDSGVRRAIADASSWPSRVGIGGAVDRLSIPAILYRIKGEEMVMDEAAKKTALRMIPYGIYVLTAREADGTPHAATINWVTQTSFSPPLVAMGIKADSGVYAALKATGVAVLNMLGKGQQGPAFAFFKPAVAEDGKLSGEAVHDGGNGVPVIDSAPAAVECKLVQIVEQGDHHVVIVEVTDAALSKPIEGRPDEAILEMKDLGEKVFYGG